MILPGSVPGIVTGTILLNEEERLERRPQSCSPRWFLSTRFLPDSIFDPVMALPYHLYILATNVPGAEGQKSATALVLLGLVVAFYALALWIRHRSAAAVKW